MLHVYQSLRSQLRGAGKLSGVPFIANLHHTMVQKMSTEAVSGRGGSNTKGQRGRMAAGLGLDSRFRL
jgi:hypothetical protein